MSKKIVIIGGGTGTSVVIRALKAFDLELTNVVTVFDSGGSSRRLVDEFGFLPIGDLRQSLAALANDNSHSWIQQLLLYRFAKGEGLKGHNLGNLILTALQDMTGSTPEALEIAAKSFRLKGKIYPVSTNKADLVAFYEDGTKVVGEHILDDASIGGKRIVDIKLSQSCNLYSKAKSAIEEADFVILGPGDLYASIIPNLVVKGTKEALKKSKAKFIYVVNLMTRYSQTHDYQASDHLREIERYAGRKMDYVLINTGEIDPEILRLYKDQSEFPVVDDLEIGDERQIIRRDLSSSVTVTQNTADEVSRSLMRHDKNKLAMALLEII